MWTELFILGTDTSLQTTRIYAENELANHNERIHLTDDWKQLIDLYDAIFLKDATCVHFFAYFIASCRYIDILLLYV